ncbi:MAG TPA: PhnD/SsuA/transferrin family substrate-binding protein [Casimicrobiaceae bacterium]|nr:PhnD/SsuA/transferrin family substrate-binding protein [Casimicrobiaceae bacterium]
MNKLSITLATWDYDRVRPILDGRVEIEGCEPNCLVLPPEECFHRAYLHGEFEVSEIGFSPYLIAVSRNQCPYVAVPVFLSRGFRHSAIYIRTDRGIRAPADLKGKTIGVVEYQMSAVMWARGMLADEYDVQPREVRWRQGGLDVPGRKDKFPLNLPPDFPLEPVPEGMTLSKMLAEGRLDAVIAPRAPTCYGDGKAPVARLFEDFASAERDYFKRTRVFPIMHALGIRNDVHERHPWLAASLYKAFAEAKRIATADLFEFTALKIGLPWIVSHARETRELMGEDFWPYGIAANRHTLEVMTRYSFDQGLAVRKLAPEELFAEGVRDV